MKDDVTIFYKIITLMPNFYLFEKEHDISIYNHVTMWIISSYWCTNTKSQQNYLLTGQNKELYFIEPIREVGKK